MISAPTKSRHTVSSYAERDALVREFAAGLPEIYGTGYAVSTPHVLATEHWGVLWVRKFPDGDDGSCSAKYSESMDVRVVTPKTVFCN